MIVASTSLRAVLKLARVMLESERLKRSNSRFEVGRLNIFLKRSF